MEMTQVDPVTREILRNSLIASSEEMKTAILKTSHSPIVNEMRDFSCNLFDPMGQTVAQTSGLTIFLGLLSMAAQTVVAKFGTSTLREGDLLVTNDAYESGTHINDLQFISPSFYDGQM